jgi:hypothetical protein
MKNKAEFDSVRDELTSATINTAKTLAAALLMEPSQTLAVAHEIVSRASIFGDNNPYMTHYATATAQDALESSEQQG